MNRMRRLSKGQSEMKPTMPNVDLFVHPRSRSRHNPKIACCDRSRVRENVVKSSRRFGQNRTASRKSSFSTGRKVNGKLKKPTIHVPSRFLEVASSRRWTWDQFLSRLHVNCKRKEMHKAKIEISHADLPLAPAFRITQTNVANVERVDAIYYLTEFCGHRSCRRSASELFSSSRCCSVASSVYESANWRMHCDLVLTEPSMDSISLAIAETRRAKMTKLVTTAICGGTMLAKHADVELVRVCAGSRRWDAFDANDEVVKV